MFVSPLILIRLLTHVLTVVLCTGALLQAEPFVPSAQELAMAALVTGNSEQKREFMARSDILCRVARARAADLAKRAYFAHVNPDGVGPNYLVRQAGYALPTWWGFGMKDNYIESIAAGQSSASGTFTSWMNSAPHKEHVLGKTDFYQNEVVYGVGYAHVPGSRYTDYWVFLSAPAEEGRSIQVLTPEDGLTLTDSPNEDPKALTYSGIVTGLERAVAVRYSVSDRSTSSSGKQYAYGILTGHRWTFGAANSVNYGRTSLTFESMRANGTVIDSQEIEVNRTSTSILTVQTTGSGSVTAGFFGESARNLLTPYTIVATPAPGWVFDSWSGPGIASHEPNLTFAMQSGLTLRATFVPDPLAGSKGRYLAFGGVNLDTILDITIEAGGTFAGSFAMGAQTLSLSGGLSPTGSATLVVQSTTVQLHYDGLEKTLTVIAAGRNLEAPRVRLLSKKEKAPNVGSFAVILASARPEEGSGFGTLTITKKGSISLAGYLADGSNFKMTGAFRNDGSVLIWEGAPEIASGSRGVLQFANTDVSDLSGDLRWQRPGQTSAEVLSVVGCTSLKNRGFFSSKSSYSVEIGGADLGSPVTADLSPVEREPLAVAGENSLQLSLTMPKRGDELAGTFRHPDRDETITFRTKAFSMQGGAFGFFQSGGLSGYVTVTRK